MVLIGAGDTYCDTSPSSSAGQSEQRGPTAHETSTGNPPAARKVKPEPSDASRSSRAAKRSPRDSPGGTGIAESKRSRLPDIDERAAVQAEEALWYDVRDLLQFGAPH